MSDRKRAGEPAGAPEPEPRADVQAPDVQAPDVQAPDVQAPDGQAPAQPEREAVEQDIEELLSEVRSERDEYLELAQRTKADFENYRRRAARDAAEAERRGKSALARELVPVLDNLERALRAANIDPDAEQADDGDGDGGGLAHGVLLVYRDLRSAVERAGVETYDPAGERFDPTWHEALSTRPAGEAEPGTVLETVEKGYRLDDQVLRPARVIVSAS